MPRPPVAARNSPSKSRVRELAIRAGSTPRALTAFHLPGLAVPYTSAPRCRASCTAAVPTPPAAAWMRIDSPARSPARSVSA